ncbi:MAG TPA: S8 family serine peptidase, partial [Planctomycetota bacterium]|nr:S8 family serine peptidase [Planctomycetota bacterium]
MVTAIVVRCWLRGEGRDNAMSFQDFKRRRTWAPLNRALTPLALALLALALAERASPAFAATPDGVQHETWRGGDDDDAEDDADDAEDDAEDDADDAEDDADDAEDDAEDDADDAEDDADDAEDDAADDADDAQDDAEDDADEAEDDANDDAADAAEDRAADDADQGDDDRVRSGDDDSPADESDAGDVSGDRDDDDDDAGADDRSGDEVDDGDHALELSPGDRPSAPADSATEPLDEVEVETDEDGFGYRDREILAMDLDPTSLELARELGFEVASGGTLGALGGSIHVLRAPRGSTAVEAMDRIRRAAPTGAFALNHLYYEPAAGRVGPASRTASRLVTTPCHCRVGVLDTGVRADHPAFTGVAVRQRAFGAEAVKPADHGTAVASLIFGARESGASELYVADVFAGGKSSAGAASSIVKALDWLAASGAPVINLSLSGPANPVVERAVNRLTARGVVVVVAGGNEGPAAPPAYPAAYRDVIAVTAVDSGGKAYRYAGRGEHIDFAAVGVAVPAARAAGDYAPVTGTSFAAPVVSGRLARKLKKVDAASARRAEQAL